MNAGCDEIGLADTTGYADPDAVGRVVRVVRHAVGDKAVTEYPWTRAGGASGWTDDVRFVAGGLRGCPFAPGASGNIVTEDLVFMLDAMGIRTGIDVDTLLAVREIVADALPKEELYGFVAKAGLPLGYREAA